MISDPIADMLNRIRNAHLAGLKQVDMPHSKVKSEIARIMKREGFITDYVVEGGDARKILRVFLRYEGGGRQPVIRGLRRISRPGLRKYAASDSIPRVLGGMGVAIMSTSSGIVSDNEARQMHVGGEVLCYAW